MNIDLNADPNDAEHSGSNGVYSTTGTIWNPILVGDDEGPLDDEFGDLTPLGISFGGSSSGTDGSATNDLQDSGSFSDFEVAGLLPGNAYDVAVYGGGNMGFGFTDSTGSSGGFCTGTLTYALPGTAGLDYCTFTGRMPADLGDGFGFGFGGIDGMITGVQIRGRFATPVPALPQWGLVALAGLLVASCLAALRRRASAR